MNNLVKDEHFAHLNIYLKSKSIWHEILTYDGNPPEICLANNRRAFHAYIVLILNDELTRIIPTSV